MIELPLGILCETRDKRFQRNVGDPTIANLKRLGRLFGVPYIPVTKWIFLVPKPTRFQLLYGKPMYFEGSGHERDEVVNAMVDEVRERIRDLIRQGRQLREKEISEEDLVL